jgi:hypothetical protein
MPSLIIQRTLSQCLQLDIDSINCWIRSVGESIQASHHHDTQQRLNSSRFFAPFYAAGRTPRMLPPQVSDSSDETYSTQYMVRNPNPSGQGSVMMHLVGNGA